MDKDIINAIAAEQEYLKANDSELSLPNMLEPFGYQNLTEYFHDKVKYQLVNENLTINDYTLEDGIDSVYETLTNGGAGAFTVKENYNRSWIWADKNNSFLDVEKAEELGYTIRNFRYNGGPIITSNTDFSLALVIPNYIDFDIMLIMDFFINFLKSKGYDPVYDNNDLMLDGKKVMGNIYYRGPESSLIAFQISLIDHTDEIKLLSKKESTKIPGFISDIARDELQEAFELWLHTI